MFVKINGVYYKSSLIRSVELEMVQKYAKVFMEGFLEPIITQSEYTFFRAFTQYNDKAFFTKGGVVIPYFSVSGFEEKGGVISVLLKSGHTVSFEDKSEGQDFRTEWKEYLKSAIIND